MMRVLKCYFAFSGLIYRLIMFLGMPVLMIGFHCYILQTRGWDMSLVLLLGWSCIEIFADSWFLGGIQSKECEKLDYLKTSPKGIQLFRSTLVADVLRRLLTAVGLTIIFRTISQYTVSEERRIWGVEGMEYLVFAVLSCFALAQIGVFLARFSGYLWFNMLIAYLLFQIGGVIVLLIRMSEAVLFPGIVFACLAILFAVLPVMVGMRRMEGSFYDR